MGTRTILEKEKTYLVVGDVRGEGLIQGTELVRDRKTKEPATREIGHLVEATCRRGLLIGRGGLPGNTVRLTPPLIASQQDIRQALEILDHAFAEVQETM
jgi:alanine-glyoxylate transaminase/(R)-3-amino-2-methylpropionate-pyruvate transaminase